MNKFLLSLGLVLSSSCFAFPAYNVVDCTGVINGHNMFAEYNRATHLLHLKVDGNQGTGYANESGNRIYTNPEYDQYGNVIVGEIISNSSNWNATFNVYANNQLALSGPLSCQKSAISADLETQTSVTSALSALQTL